MSGYYWIKFYHESLDDPKVATLPDRLWRRFYECCLLAGMNGKEGVLPDIQHMAWKLRLPIDDLMLDLKQLASAKLLEQKNNTWIVKNFSKRQAPATSTERVQQLRQRRKHQQYADETNETGKGNEIETFRYTDLDIDIESEIDKGINKEVFNNIKGNKKEILSVPFSKKNKINSQENQFSNNGWIECERLYTMITNQPIIPTTHPEALTELQAILDLYKNNIDKAIEEGKIKYATWCNTKGSSGKPYSRTNTAWLGKWIEELSPQPDSKLSEDEEYQKKVKMIQEATKYQR